MTEIARHPWQGNGMQFIQAIVACLSLQRLVEPRSAVVDAQFGKRRGVAAWRLQVELIKTAMDVLQVDRLAGTRQRLAEQAVLDQLVHLDLCGEQQIHLLGTDSVAPGLPGEYPQPLSFLRTVLYRLVRPGLALDCLIDQLQTPAAQARQLLESRRR